MGVACFRSGPPCGPPGRGVVRFGIGSGYSMRVTSTWVIFIAARSLDRGTARQAGPPRGPAFRVLFLPGAVDTFARWRPGCEPCFGQATLRLSDAKARMSRKRETTGKAFDP